MGTATKARTQAVIKLTTVQLIHVMKQNFHPQHMVKIVTSPSSWSERVMMSAAKDLNLKPLFLRFGRQETASAPVT